MLKLSKQKTAKEPSRPQGSGENLLERAVEGGDDSRGSVVGLASSSPSRGTSASLRPGSVGARSCAGGRVGHEAVEREAGRGRITCPGLNIFRRVFF